jgi:hypothetical protein
MLEGFEIAAGVVALIALLAYFFGPWRDEP